MLKEVGMLLESSSNQITNTSNGYNNGDVFNVDPSLSLCEDIQIQKKEMLISQLLYIEETQLKMHQYQLQSTQLRDQCNPLVERLLDLQDRKSKIDSGEKVHEQRRNPEEDGGEEPSVSTVHSSQLSALSFGLHQLPLSEQTKTPEVTSFRKATVSKIRLRRIRDSSSWLILTPEMNGDQDTSVETYKKPRAKLENQ